MARIVLRVDDFTDETGADEVTFALRDKVYTIDLVTDGVEEFEAVLKPYIDRATPAGKLEIGKPLRQPPAEARTSLAHGGRHTPEEVTDCRAWADKHGIELGPRRIPNDVWEAAEHDDVTLLRPGRIPGTESSRQLKMNEAEQDAEAS